MKTIKRTVKSTYFLIIFILLMSSIVLAATIATIDNLYVGGDAKGSNGQDVFVYINARQVVGVENVALDFIYDKNVLNAYSNGVSAGTLVTGSINSNVDNNAGKISITINGITGADGSFAKIKFHVIGNVNDKSNLNIQNIATISGGPINVGSITNAIFAVVDTTPPTITGITTITKEATGNIPDPAGNRTTVDLSAVKCQDDSGSCTLTNNAPDGFPVGTTIITWTAKDGSGNSVTAQQSITITDTTPPSLNIPVDLVVEATGTLSKIDIGKGTAVDLVDPNPTLTNNAPPNGFSIGTTFVVWLAKDKFGNSVQKTQIVTVKDTTPPVINVADITIEATGPKTSVILGVTAKDLVDPNPTLTNNGPSDSMFSVGTTRITWTAKDSSGNTATAEQSVTVKDTTPPIITVSNIIKEATGPKTSVILGATAKDLVDPNPTLTNNGPIDGMFPVGVTNVIWTATDNSKNTVTAEQIVTITDKTPPTITAPANIIQEATASKTLVVLGTPAVKDLVDPSPTVTNNGPTDGMFPVGVTNVTWTVTDHSGNSASAEQTVTITDTSSPTITAPANIIKEATGSKTLVVLGTPTVKDPIDPSPTVTNNGPTDSMFPVGVTIVVWKATDHSGNSASVNQTITITDKTPPNLKIPANIEKEATGPKTLVVLGNATATDLADPNPIITNDAPTDGFSVGITNVTWKATDFSGNINYANQTITITDKTAPSIILPSDIITMATGVKTKVNIGNANATDLVDPTPNITNDAPSDGMFPVGVTKITWKATDKSGNSVTGIQSITIEGDSGINLSADPLYRQVNPNDNATYSINITNTGLVGDSFDLILNSSMEKQNLNIDNKSINLGPQETKLLTLVTSDSHIGSRATYLTATSITNHSKKATITIITEVIAKSVSNGPSGGSSGGSSGSNGGSGGGSGGGGGGGGGGGSAPSSEPFANINKSESRDRDLVPNIAVTYTFSTPDLGIYEAGVTGSNSEIDVPMKVELLKGAATGTDKLNTGLPYKYLNLYIGSKKVSKVYVRFKVNNQWLDNSGVSKNDVKLFRWDTNTKKWIGLVTSLLKSDSNYTYFDSEPDHFSSFAIVGLNPQSVKKAYIIPVSTPNTGTVGTTGPSSQVNNNYPVATYIEDRQPVANIEDLKGDKTNNGIIIGLVLVVLVAGFIVWKKRKMPK